MPDHPADKILEMLWVLHIPVHWQVSPTTATCHGLGFLATRLLKTARQKLPKTAAISPFAKVCAQPNSSPVDSP
jgi:hypothetical protein